MSAIGPMTVPQLAEKMGLSRIAVYNKVKSGQIKARRVGRIYEIPASEVEAILSGSPTASQKRRLRAAVRRAVREYGSVLERLSKC